MQETLKFLAVAEVAAVYRIADDVLMNFRMLDSQWHVLL